MDKIPGQWILPPALVEQFCCSHNLRTGEKSQGEWHLYPLFAKTASCIHIITCAQTHSKIHVWLIHSCIHICPPTVTYTHTHTHTPPTLTHYAVTYAHACIHTHNHICPHTHIHTLHIHICPHTNAWKEMWKPNRCKSLQVRYYIENLLLTIVENLEKLKWKWKLSIK